MNAERGQPALFVRNVKRCKDCGLEKPLEDFPRHRNYPDGRFTYCKPCHNARGKESKERLHGGSRHYHLKRRYGVGDADVAAMVRAQGGRCAICRREAAVHVDHDHVTGLVRGVLCFNCNGGLGQFKDDINKLRRAIAYLESAAEVAVE
jgi:hypothetical protein